MCFSPKVKMPKQDPAKIAAPAPAPLAEQVQGVQFGSNEEEEMDKDTSTGSDTKESKRSGKSSLRVELSSNRQTSGGAKRASVKSRMGGK